MRGLGPIAAGLVGLVLLAPVAGAPGADSGSDLIEEFADPPGGLPPVLTAEELLASQPTELVARLRDKRVVMMQEVRERGALSGGLIVALVGGLESLPGALLAGLLLGVLENVSAGYLDPLVGGGVKEVAAYVLLLFILLFKPYGLFGLVRIERI